MIRKAVIGAAAAAAVVSGILSGTARVKQTSAYFTDQTSKTNIYTFGDITADGTETEWKPEKAAHLLPKETAEKNPKVVNTGMNAAVVFIVLDSPCAAGLRTAKDDGSLQDPENKELWEYLSEGETTGFEQHWLLLETEYTDASGTVISKGETAAPEKTAAVRRVFGYRDALPGKNGEVMAETEPLFQKIRARNYVEGSVPEKTAGIQVRFLAVQAEHLSLVNGITTDLTNTKNMDAAMLRGIWDQIFAGGSLSDLPDADIANHLDLHGQARSA